MIHLDQIPTNQYDIIEADSPWNYKDNGYNGYDTVQKYRIHTPYDQMSLHELSLLGPHIERVSKPTAQMYSWATKDFRLDAELLMREWGFEYKFEIPWIKTTDGLKPNMAAIKHLAMTKDEADRISAAMRCWGQPGKPCEGMGKYARNLHEILLYGTRDTSHKPDLATTQPAIIMAPKSGHSRKPEASYELIVNNSMGLKRLSMFQREHRPGFDCWGHGVGGYKREEELWHGGS